MDTTRMGRILVVDDDERLRSYLRETLASAGYVVEAVGCAADAVTRLTSAEPDVDLLLVDVAMPRMSGFELLDRVRGLETTARIPAVILSGYADCDHKVAGLRHGANDYLVKPVDGEELLARVDAHLRVSRELERWRRQTRFDALTGLLNRHGFTEQLEREVERATRHAHELAVAFIDLDRFKTINDTLGHSVGDEILCEVAQALSRSLRACDVAARWGGDEFVVAFPDASREQAEQGIARVREALSSAARRERSVGLSVGIVELASDDARDRRRTVERLVDAADRAMYRDKLSNESTVSRLQLVEGGPT